VLAIETSDLTVSHLALYHKSWERAGRLPKQVGFIPPPDGCAPAVAWRDHRRRLGGLCRNAFAKLLLYGEQGAGLEFSPAEREAFDRVTRLKGEPCAMSLTDTAGGYLVPFEMDPS
jgi:hypothetical protein